MPDLKRALERGGFTDVRTVISSGNAVFTSGGRWSGALEKKVEGAIESGLGRAFPTLVRPVAELEALLEEDPFARFRLPPTAKRNVTFVRGAPGAAKLADKRILAVREREILSYYTPADGPGFMVMLEKAFGKDITTRTWETVGRIVKAS